MKKHMFPAVLVVYIIYALFYINSSSVTVDGEKYFVLIDDAMISMQFAKNFSGGNGLVWSHGEKVEGFTNPLWTAYMILPHLLKIPLNMTSLFIQLSALFLMAGTLVLVKRISLVLTGREDISLAAVLLTAFFTPLNFWFYQGMEVSLLTFLVSLVIYMVIVGKNDRLIFVLCGIATLVRIDMALFFLIILAVRRKNIREGLLIFLAFISFQTILRYAYFGEFFPNTYFLKLYKWDLHERIFKGTVTLVKNLYYMNWLIFILPLLLIRRGRVYLFLLTVPAVQMAYSIYVGGDAWEAMGGTNRYVTIAMPVFFVLLAAAVFEVSETIIKDRRYSVFAAAALTLVCIVNLNCLHGTRSLKNMTGPVDELPFTKSRLEQALFVRDNAGNNDRIGVFAAGIIPYFSEKKYFADFLGKNDKHIARLPVIKSRSMFELILHLPGHMKYDNEYIISNYNPKFIVVPDDNAKKMNFVTSKYTNTAHPDIFVLK